MGIIKIKKEQETKKQVIQTEPVELNDSKHLKELHTKKFDDKAILFEDETKANSNSKHYVLNNGTEKTLIYSEPINYLDETDNKWKEIQDIPDTQEKVVFALNNITNK